MGGDVIEDRAKIGKCRKGVTKPHRPCLAHTARTCSSVANSPRAAAAFDAATAACSSAVSGTAGSSSAPASRPEAYNNQFQSRGRNATSSDARRLALHFRHRNCFSSDIRRV